MSVDIENMKLEELDVNELLKDRVKTLQFFKQNAFIEASAGTGKTYTVTKLLERLIQEDFEARKNLKEILVVTFTEKAAGELKNRIGKEEAEVYTIHSFCKMVLDTYSFEANAASKVSLVSNKNLLKEIVERNCREDWLSVPENSPLEKFLKTKEIDEVIKDVEALALKHIHGEVELHEVEDNLYITYCNEKAIKAYEMWRNQEVTSREQVFDDLILKVRDELENESGMLLKKLRERYSYAIIDEFQDTNISQWSIFKKIFMCENHHILVVGDPKQAIFGFQGSNLNVYNIAKKEFDIGYSLSRNFRSASYIIEVCNGISKCLITEGFNPSKFGKPNDQKENVYFATKTEDPSTRVKPPVHVYEISSKSADKAREEYYAWVLRKILGFRINPKNKTSNVYIPEKKMINGEECYEPRPLRYSDITILGRTKDELYDVMEYLRRANIPCARYKDENLLKRLAVTHWAALLKGIDCIFEKDETSKAAIRAALLTKFFDFTTVDITGLEDTSSAPPKLQKAIKLLEEMNRDFAKRKKWGLFVDRILRKTGVEERFAKCKDSSNLAEFRQVADLVADYLYSENLDLSTLSRRLLQYRDEKRDPSGKNDQIIGKDSDEDQVQLMTMHVSKGLEFPVVFVVGGINYTYSANFVDVFVYNENKESSKRLAALASENKSGTFVFEETKNSVIAELKRLLYVAITRTSFLCYLPYCKEENDDDLLSINSAIKAFYEKCKRDNRDDCDDLIQWESAEKLTLSSVLNSYNIPPLPSTSDALVNHDEIDSLLYGDGGAKKSCEDAVKSIKAQLPDLADLEGVRTSTILVPKSSSYSALSGYKCGGPTADESTYRSDDPMPGGANYGNALHHIFEQIDFQRGRDCEKPENKEYVENLIKRNLRSEGVDVEKWFERYWDMIKCTLKTKFKDPYTDKTICLGDVPACDRRHEMSFDSNAILKADKVVLAPENAMGEVLFNGSIDLLFRYEGRWYILDWKSNKIGGDKPYSRNNIKENMIHHKYNLQCALYANVFLHWYSRFVQKNIEQIFKEDFGGVIYCYNRGCKEQPGCCDVENVEGFYFEKWENDFKKFQGEIQKDSTDPYEGHDLFDLEHAVNIPFRKLLCEKPVEEAKESEDDPADK